MCKFGRNKNSEKNKKKLDGLYLYAIRAHLKKNFETQKTVWMQRSTQQVNITESFFLPDL